MFLWYSVSTPSGGPTCGADRAGASIDARPELCPLAPTEFRHNWRNSKREREIQIDYQRESHTPVTKPPLRLKSKWQFDALCAQFGREIFFPREDPANAHIRTVTSAHYRDARNICLQCPVWRECLITALELEDSTYFDKAHIEPDGMFAARTPNDRVRMIRALRVQYPELRGNPHSLSSQYTPEERRRRIERRRQIITEYVLTLPQDPWSESPESAENAS